MKDYKVILPLFFLTVPLPCSLTSGNIGSHHENDPQLKDSRNYVKKIDDKKY